MISDIEFIKIGVCVKCGKDIRENESYVISADGEMYCEKCYMEVMNAKKYNTSK